MGKAFYIQIIQDPRLVRQSQRQFKSKVLIRPIRGMISDRHGESLVINFEAKSLAANPRKIAHKKAVARKLSLALGVSRKKNTQEACEVAEVSFGSNAIFQQNK